MEPDKKKASGKAPKSPSRGGPAAGKAGYGADAIEVLEGLEHVRTRPAMYIGSTGTAGLHHLVYEVVDNSIDEALAGHCDKVTIDLHINGTVTIEDNGRGIPVGAHPKFPDKDTAEVVMTMLYSGGKVQRQELRVLRGASRRRRVGGQRAQRAARSRDQARGQRLSAELRARKAADAPQGRREVTASRARRSPSGPIRRSSRRSISASTLSPSGFASCPS